MRLAVSDTYGVAGSDGALMPSQRPGSPIQSSPLALGLDLGLAGLAGRRWRFRRFLRPVAGAAALLFLMADEGITTEELLCETAMLHVTDCCPDLPKDRVACVGGGCDGTLQPDLTAERSECLKAKTCEELKALGACDLNLWQPNPSPSCPDPCETKVPPCR